MIAVADAKAIIQQAVNRGAIIETPLQDAFRLVLAEDVTADHDIPNFAQSSMDGYAIHFEDRDMPLRLSGEMAAGAAEQKLLLKGQAVRVFTGAPIPDGADTVVMQEKVRLEGNTVTIEDDNLVAGLNVRPRGAEVKEGSLAMAAGTLLTAAALGFLATIGCTHVKVFSPPSTAIILTGNELQEPGQPLQFGQVYEANSVQLVAALRAAGIREITIYRCEDDLRKLTEVLSQAITHYGLVLLNGGVSVGDYDFVVEASQACGVSGLFHKIRQKPGKPLFFGQKGNTIIFGLPGNPSSSLTCFYEYVLPALEKCMHLPPIVKVVRAVLTHSYPKPAGLTYFLKATYNNGKVTPLHAQESFRLHSFAQANSLIVLPESSTGGEAGDEVEVHLLPL